MRKRKSLILFLSALIVLSALLASCGVSPEDDRTVLTLDGKAVNFDEYDYVYRSTLAVYGDSVDKKEVEDETIDVLKNMYAVYGLADKYGIELTNDEKDEVGDYIKSYRDTYESEEKYLEFLERSYMTEWSFERILELNVLWEKLHGYIINEASGIILADDETIIKDTEENYFRATYIFIKNDENDDASENRALAESLADQAASGEDFFALVNEYGEDLNMTDNPDGRYFTEGELLLFFEEAVKALDVGEVSEAIEREDGYYIIKRLPVEKAYVIDNLNVIRESYTARRCNEIVEEYKNSIKVEYSDIYESVISGSGQ